MVLPVTDDDTPSARPDARAHEAPKRPASPHGAGAPSPWVQRWAALLGPNATVLDVACGAGRHARWLGERGCRVSALDRDTAALGSLDGAAGVVERVQADIEGAPWPLPGRRFDAVVVTNYLWRPLWPTLLASLAPGGLLICETFNIDHAQVGRPSNPNFLLTHGELIERCRGLHLIAYENGWLADPVRAVQRVAARAPLGDGDAGADGSLSAAGPRDAL